MSALESEIKELPSAIARLKSVQGLLNRAKHGESLQEKDERPQMEKILDAVTHFFWPSVNKDLSADGGDTYAELTVGSITKLYNWLSTTITITTDDIILDGGCGYNFMMAYLAQVTGCKTYGIEYVPTKVYLAEDDKDDDGRISLPQAFSFFLSSTTIKINK